jgi:hypothetical protein
MAAKLTRMTHEIAIQLRLVAENCTICSSRSRRRVRKLLDTPSYSDGLVSGSSCYDFCRSLWWRVWNFCFVWKAFERFPRRIFKPSSDFVQFLLIERSTFRLLLQLSNYPVCLNLFTVLWIVSVSGIVTSQSLRRNFDFHAEPLFTYLFYMKIRCRCVCVCLPCYFGSESYDSVSKWQRIAQVIYGSRRKSNTWLRSCEWVAPRRIKLILF